MLLAAPATAADDDADVLADGQSVPTGFVSLKATGPPGDMGARLELIFEDASTGAVVRYRTARGSMANVKPSENLHHGIFPIDVCVNDVKTGKTLFFPQTFDSPMMIDGCRLFRQRDRSAEFQRSQQAAIKGLEVLETVRFRDDYEPERKQLLRDLKSVKRSGQEHP
jgi:hypothetical protein